MQKPFSLFFLFYIFTVHLFGQTEPYKKQVEKDYEAFKGLFEAQFENDTITISVPTEQTARRGNFSPVALPAWFFDGLNHHTGHHVAHGISDPGMDSVSAFNQAFARALSMLALSREYEIENVLDNYYLDKETRKTLGKFNSFTSIFAELSFNPENISIIEQDYNANQEAVLLISLAESQNPTKDCDRVRILMENFESELTRSKKPAIIGKSKNWLYHETCSGAKELFSYHRIFSPEGIVIESGNDTMSTVEFDHWFQYKIAKDIDSIKVTNPYPQYFSLKYGLWEAWQNAVINHLEQLEVFNSKVKNLDEQTNSEFQILTRVIFSGKGSFTLKNVIIDNNELLLEFN
ncbi:MAG: hypothetical protein IH598_04850 [Bacteroidales bacterium]|nr:hypothetical protein [Bacteroidales bacterium]